MSVLEFKLCGQCAHYARDIGTSACLHCLPDRDKPAWEPAGVQQHDITEAQPDRETIELFVYEETIELFEHVCRNCGALFYVAEANREYLSCPFCQDDIMSAEQTGRVGPWRP